jgi:hypothetical protein
MGSKVQKNQSIYSLLCVIIFFCDFSSAFSMVVNTIDFKSFKNRLNKKNYHIMVVLLCYGQIHMSNLFQFVFLLKIKNRNLVINIRLVNLNHLIFNLFENWVTYKLRDVMYIIHQIIFSNFHNKWKLLKINHYF